MNLVLFRIDERLIHGQVSLAWTRARSAQRIVVVNDELADNTMQQKLMTMSVPQGVKTSFMTKEQAISKSNNDEFNDEKILLLVKNPIDALVLVENGLQTDKINVGGVRHEEKEITKLSKEVAVTDKELEALKKLDEKGIILESQWVPDQNKTKLNDKLKEV